MKEQRTSSPMKDLRGYLTTEELDRIEEASKHLGRKPDMNYIFIRLLRVTGRRVSEILQLKPSDIDFENRQVMWHILKKHSLEPVLRLKWLDTKTVRDLDIYIRHHQIPPDKRVFKFSRQQADKLVKRAGRKAGIEMVGSHKLHAHHFRHSFAVNYLRRHKGSSQALRELQTILEHSHVGMTTVYLQFSDEDMKENYDAAMEDKEDDNKLEDAADGSNSGMAADAVLATTGGQ